jgi:hypothetical protein
MKNNFFYIPVFIVCISMNSSLYSMHINIPSLISNVCTHACEKTPEWVKVGAVSSLPFVLGTMGTAIRNDRGYFREFMLDLKAIIIPSLIPVTVATLAARLGHWKHTSAHDLLKPSLISACAASAILIPTLITAIKQFKIHYESRNKTGTNGYQEVPFKLMCNTISKTFLKNSFCVVPLYAFAKRIQANL